MTTSAVPKKTLVVLQPGYLPWLGFFDQMRRADIFVYYDDVQFDKHGWRNRNRIKSPEGPYWLTVPVLHHGKGQPLINDTLIDARSRWARKHVGTLRQYYAQGAVREAVPAGARRAAQPPVDPTSWTSTSPSSTLMADWLALSPNDGPVLGARHRRAPSRNG